ncbi:MAG: hypothetical protein H7841_15865 [Magnetospirillum sp. WYHS-4]
MRLARLPLAALFLFAAVAARADGTLACPDLAGARQVGNCPTDADFAAQMDALCGDDAMCLDNFKIVKQVRNVALWETPDGAFSGYISCALPPDGVPAAKLEGLYLIRKEMTGVTCLYSGNVKMSYRTKETCGLPDGRAARSGEGALRVDCRADPKACVVTCK